jgi:hypothetical protein
MQKRVVRVTKSRIAVKRRRMSQSEAEMKVRAWSGGASMEPVYPHGTHLTRSSDSRHAPSSARTTMVSRVSGSTIQKVAGLLLLSMRAGWRSGRQ